MADVKTICVRFNLSKPIHKKAYDYLKNQSEFKSYSSAIATAVADFFDVQEREDRLVEKFKIALSGVAISPTTIIEVAPEKSEETEPIEIDFDFLGG